MRRAALNVFILKKDNTASIEKIIQSIKSQAGDLCTITIFDSYQSMKSRLNNSVGLVVIQSSLVFNTREKTKAIKILQSENLNRTVLIVHDIHFEPYLLKNLLSFEKASWLKSFLSKIPIFRNALYKLKYT